MIEIVSWLVAGLLALAVYFVAFYVLDLLEKWMLK